VRASFAAKAGEEGVAGATAFHHTTTTAVESIMRQGLRSGSYVTRTRGLRPLQAHIELALNPAGGARNAVLDVDLAGLRRAGYEIPRVRRVSGRYKMAGGGYEMQFPYEIPPEYLSVRPR
jgi:RNA:NAD 2'-phosphotransferase (TPT1/KptA family)